MGNEFSLPTVLLRGFFSNNLANSIHGAFPSPISTEGGGVDLYWCRRLVSLNFGQLVFGFGALSGMAVISI